MRMPGVGASESSSSATSETEESLPEEGDDSADWRRRDENGKYVCTVCDVVVKKPALLRQHMASHSEEHKFERGEMLQTKAIPDPIRTLKSNALGRNSTGMGDLSGSPGVRPFVCPMESCDKSYKRQDHLNRHVLVHQGKLFLCPVEGCEVSFTGSSNLQRHLRLHKKWGIKLLRGSKGTAQETLICPEAGCGKSFRYPSLLRTHMENMHGEGAVDYATLVCMELGCGESFQDLSQLRVHKKTSHCCVVCEVCGLSMLKRQLKMHKFQHEGEAPCIRCPHPGCLHSYTQQSNLTTHIRAVHMELKPYACSHENCGMRFAYKVVRDNHEKSSVHLKPSEDDFESEDLEFRTKPRGGRKRIGLQKVDDLLWKRQ